MDLKKVLIGFGGLAFFLLLIGFVSIIVISKSQGKNSAAIEQTSAEEQPDARDLRSLRER